MLGSVGALVAAVIIRFTGWNAADPVLSVVLSLLIVVGAWRLVRESVDVLLESAPAHVKLHEVRRVMLAVDGVTDVHDLHVWTVTSGVVALAAHATVPDLEHHPGVLAALSTAVCALGIGHATIQLETVGACAADVLAAEAGSGQGHPHDHEHAQAHDHGPAGAVHQH
jgi:cobalt-zinc-cadmium efflux system protein